MNRIARPLLIALILFVFGGLLSFTAPAVFLDQLQNRLLFHFMSVGSRADEVARLMTKLKFQGVKGIILIGKIEGAAESESFSRAVTDSNVDWVINPQSLDSNLRAKVRCLPLLHLQDFRSVVIANGVADRSVASLALSCTGDTAAIENIGNKQLKIPFSKSEYASVGTDMNFTLACITADDGRDKIKYVTPAGVRSKSEYILDICDALINRQFLIEPTRLVTVPIIALAALSFALFRRGRFRFFVFGLVCFALMAAELISRNYLPLCQVTLAYLTSLIVIPMLENSASLKSDLIFAAAIFLKSVPSVLGTLLMLGASTWEFFFQHYQHDQLPQLLALVIFPVFVLLAKSLRPEQQQDVGRSLMIVFLAIAFAMALLPHCFQPDPGWDAYYQNVARWRGWTVDPNNSAIVVGLCGVMAFSLKQRLNKALQPLFLFIGVVCLTQLFRSYSRIGLLSAAIGACFCLAPQWEMIAAEWKKRILYVLLLMLATTPFALASLHGSQILFIRRALSFTNFMDLSWANRLYVLPGTIQMAFCRPFVGWGWGNVLPLHKRLFCPTFLPDNTAVLLNDYAHIAASYGLLAFGGVVLMIVWGLLVKSQNPLRPIVAVGAVAMFFQGVIRIPIVLLPFVLALALIFAESPPWKAKAWQGIKVSIFALVPVAMFLTVWCLLPLLNTSKPVFCRENQFGISNSNRDRFVIAFVSDENVLARAAEARAAACLGATAILTGPGNIPSLKKTYGPNIWFFGVTNEARALQVADLDSKSGREIGLWVVRMAYAAGQEEVPMCPDRPFDLALVVNVIFVCGVFALAGRIYVYASNPYGAFMAGLIAVSCIFYTRSKAEDWRMENNETAGYARQMRRAVIPDEIYREYVLNPDIGQNFSIRHRREMWHTFYQTARAEKLPDMIGRIKESMSLQFLIRPDSSDTIAGFETLWQARSCNLHERWYLLAAVLRTLDVPARFEEEKLQVWDATGWQDVEQ